MIPSVLAGVLVAMAIALLLTRLSTIERRLNRLSRVDAKLDALLRHAGIAFDEFQDCPPDVRAAIDRNETVLAIKRYRQATGAGLKEAKEFIDEVRRRKVTSS
jgi:ribosomal protein L7/L12